MREVAGNIWDYWVKGGWVVIPTNGVVKADGCAVMGAGLALQASVRFPRLSTELGSMIREYGNDLYSFVKYRLITFPTKHHWRNRSDINLIEDSTKELILLAPSADIYLPRLGCGNGGLSWEEVEPILDRILGDDPRFNVVKYILNERVTYEKGNLCQRP